MWQYRNAAGLSLDVAAQTMGWAGPKLSRIETANGYSRPGEVAPLLKAYGVVDPEVVSALEARGLTLPLTATEWTAFHEGVIAGEL
ncbi:MAG: helix-turn-helix domain-containing protein [Streptomyces sp.]|nr:helix-turn-helix domain-containing protein [Streptomyces sp.]